MMLVCRSKIASVDAELGGLLLNLYVIWQQVINQVKPDCNRTIKLSVNEPNYVFTKS